VPGWFLFAILELSNIPQIVFFNGLSRSCQRVKERRNKGKNQIVRFNVTFLVKWGARDRTIERYLMC
jgi:hypothetical protein